MATAQTQRPEDELENKENVSFLANKIDSLQEHGINVSDIKKLEAAGICSVEAMQMATKKTLLNIRGITEARCVNLLNAAAKISNKGIVIHLYNYR